MARLEILVHLGCLSEQQARTLAQEIRDELPNWEIDVRSAAQEDKDNYRVFVFPAFLLDGRILSTGIPRKGDYPLLDLMIQTWHNLIIELET